jgi:mono/diheme cytochrome c family protein
MRGRTATLLFAIAFTGFAGGIAIHASGASQTHATGHPLSADERVPLLAKGKELFLARCSRCHGEKGDKPLRTGVPLTERLLSSDVIARAVKGRLRDVTEEERRALTLYISSLMKARAPEGKTASKP